MSSSTSSPATTWYSVSLIFLPLVSQEVGILQYRQRRGLQAGQLEGLAFGLHPGRGGGLQAAHGQPRLYAPHPTQRFTFRTIKNTKIQYTCHVSAKLVAEIRLDLQVYRQRQGSWYFIAVFKEIPSWIQHKICCLQFRKIIYKCQKKGGAVNSMEYLLVLLLRHQLQ